MSWTCYSHIGFALSSWFLPWKFCFWTLALLRSSGSWGMSVGHHLLVHCLVAEAVGAAVEMHVIRIRSEWHQSVQNQPIPKTWVSLSVYLCRGVVWHAGHHYCRLERQHTSSREGAETRGGKELLKIASGDCEVWWRPACMHPIINVLIAESVCMSTQWIYPQRSAE
jgi:hypothetical protein